MKPDCLRGHKPPWFCLSEQILLLHKEQGLEGSSTPKRGADEPPERLKNTKSTLAEPPPAASDTQQLWMLEPWKF